MISVFEMMKQVQRLKKKSLHRLQYSIQARFRQGKTAPDVSNVDLYMYALVLSKRNISRSGC